MALGSHRTGLLILFVLLLVPCLATAGETGSPGVLVSEAWLAEHLDDPGLLVLHVGRPEGYAEEHIPGARLISVRSLLTETPAGIRDEMPPVADLEEIFTQLGADENSRFVICYQEAMAMPWAARVLLTLDYLGAGDRSYLLDGGLEGWRAAGRPMSEEAPVEKAGDFHARVNEGLIVDAAWLSEHLKDPQLVLLDARPKEQYRGEDPSHGPRSGHIAGAANLPFFTLAQEDPDYHFKNNEEMAAMLTAAGAAPGKTLVVYCGTGIWASPLYVVARHLGFEVRFYDGGFQEWSALEEMPVTAPVDPELLKG